MIHFYAVRGQYLFEQYLELWGQPVADRFRSLHYQDLPSQMRFDGGTYVFAGLDQLNAAQLRLVTELHAQLVANGARVLNDPNRVLRRFDLLVELAKRERNVYRVARVHDDLHTLRFPVFVRSEDTHDGALTPLLHSVEEVETWIGRLRATGRSPRTMMVVEFCDTGDATGHYRKYAAFCVGKRTVARSLEYGTNWMLKRAGTEYSRAMAMEEQEFVATNPHAAQLEEIFAIANIEYGRIDYAVKDGRVQTWEINLNPTIGRGLRPSAGKVPRELDAVREETKRLFYAGFNEAWSEVDSNTTGELPIALDGDLRAAARFAEPRESFLRKTLRPLKPFLLRHGSAVFRVVGKLSRRHFV